MQLFDPAEHELDAFGRFAVEVRAGGFLLQLALLVLERLDAFRKRRILALFFERLLSPGGVGRP